MQAKFEGNGTWISVLLFSFHRFPLCLPWTAPWWCEAELLHFDYNAPHVWQLAPNPCKSLFDQRKRRKKLFEAQFVRMGGGMIQVWEWPCQGEREREREVSTCFVVRKAEMAASPPRVVAMISLNQIWAERWSKRRACVLKISTTNSKFVIRRKKQNPHTFGGGVFCFFVALTKKKECVEFVRALQSWVGNSLLRSLF